MAGFYPDVPDNRIAYDTIGAIVVSKSGSPVAGWSHEYTDLTYMNREGPGLTLYDYGNYQSQNSMAMLLPYAFDIDSLWVASYGSNYHALNSVWWSSNTSNGIDGSWTQIAGVANRSASDKASMRNQIQNVSVSGVIALRFLFTQGFDGATFTIHLYGMPSAISNRLDFWDPTLDQAIAPAHFDWGDTARGSTNTLTYRIKNQSASLTANSIDISTEILTDGTPSLVPMFEHSTDGTNFSSNINIGNLAPGAISGTLHVRKTLTSDAPLSLWWPRFKAAPGSWT